VEANMRRRLPRTLAVFAAAFCLGAWLGSMAHALSATPESSSHSAACCRTFKRTVRSTEIHEALSTAPCLLCQLASAPVMTASATVPVAAQKYEQPAHALFALKAAPALLYYAPRGRAPPTLS